MSGPQECSSKTPVARKRDVIGVKKPKNQDPRFSQLSGTFNPDLFDRSYGFITDLQKQEQKLIETTIKIEKNPIEKEKLIKLSQQIKSQFQTKEKKQDKQDLKRKWKKEQVEVVKSGGNPYYLNKQKIKKIELIEKFNSMSGKDMDRLIEKRRKRNAAKEHKFMPN